MKKRRLNTGLIVDQFLYRPRSRVARYIHGKVENKIQLIVIYNNDYRHCWFSYSLSML